MKVLIMFLRTLSLVFLGGVGRGGGVLLGIFGGGVPSGSSNPDPISDEKMSFSTLVFRPDLFSDLAFRQKLCHYY